MINKLYVSPLCTNFWSLRFPKYLFNWTKIWLATPSCTNEARLISLNWKILHNVYPTNVLLCKMGKAPNNICHTCNVIDYIDHFFFKCKRIQHLWSCASQLISYTLSKRIVLTVETVIFNCHNNNYDHNDLRLIN